MKLKTTLGIMVVLLGSSLLAMAQQTATKTQEPTPPGLPPLPDTVLLKRPDPTPEQIEAAEKARAAQAAAVKERWEKEFAPWLHFVPPVPSGPVPFDREAALKEHAEKRAEHKVSLTRFGGQGGAAAGTRKTQADGNENETTGL